MKADEYKDMLTLPHHVSETHPQMPVHDRAAQFMPFAALRGYEEAIGESGRETEEYAELSEDDKSRLDMIWSELMYAYKKDIVKKVTVRYFEPDIIKEGGRFRTLEGEILKIDQINRTMTVNDTIVDMARIVDLQWSH